MEIYSQEQLQRILNSSLKTIIIELMDMDDQNQNNLHSEINQYILKNFTNDILLLKINKNFFNNLFLEIKKYPSFIVFKDKNQLLTNSDIHSLSEFELLIKKI